MIYVTRPYLPPLEEFIPYLEEIWHNKILTNGGTFHQQLESALCQYLGVNCAALFSNGTLGLITALQALRVTGEVITTPYSFVATTNALHWNGNKPVFVDVEPETLNIDPEKIEAAITPQTTAILAVHCYGNPCNTQAIEQIASNYNLRVIYDACHAFGVQDEGGSVLRHGDLSVLSFHATKVFTTFEGGAIICPDAKTKLRIDHLKNFGIVDDATVVAPGINGKMNEVSAAFGLLQLQYIEQLLEKRALIDQQYRALLKDVPGIYCIPQTAKQKRNHAYFPILVQDPYPLSRDELHFRLKDIGIHGRRYFYPLISDFPMYRGLLSARKDNLPVASQAARQVLCLPIYPDLELSAVDHICSFIAAQ